MRLHSVSLYNTDADVLWLSEGALGPDEHNVVIEAIEAQKADKSQSYHEIGMEDGRMAVFLPIRGPRGDLAGTVMILADLKSLTEGTMERIVTQQIRQILVKIAMFMRKSAPASPEATQDVVMPPNATPAPVNLTSTTVIEKLPAAAAASVAAAAGAAAVAPPLGPREVEQILELELVAEPPRALPPPGAASASAPTNGAATAGAGTALRKNRPGAPGVDVAPPQAKAAFRSGGAASPASRGGPTLSSVPSKGAPAKNSALGPEMPARGDEVLQFDANISIPTAKPASVVAPPADIDVLAFEPDVQVVPAKASTAPPADIEVLAFDAEPPVVTPAPVIPQNVPVARAATTVAPVVPTLSASPAAAITPAPQPPVLGAAAPTAFAPQSAAPVAAPPPASTGATSSVRSFADLSAATTGSTSSVRAFKVTSAVLPPLPTGNAAAAAKAAPAPAAATAAPVVTASPSPAPTPAPQAAARVAPVALTQPAASVAPAAPVATASPASAPLAASGPTTATTSSAATTSVRAVTPSLTTAKASSATAQTEALPVVSDDSDDEEPLLINDTGNRPKVIEAKALDTTDIEPTPQLPPLEPLSVEESATDLTLFAQELIKLRSSGRTRRYEVLARSQRDLHRNEVPAAFVAESARGKDGSALDAMVIERLLNWLGVHGEAIWDSEPASFSVNLSVGAIEDEGFPQRIQEWMEKNNVPAEYVGFEITESACVQSKPAVQRFVEAIEQMGCFLVIDNFSLNSEVFEFLGSKALRHVKLDPKLTAAAMKEKLPQAIVVAILQACKVLGVHCVAKKVESQASMQWLTAVGCDFAQSFSLHKPLPLESLASGQPIKALRD